MTACVEFVWVWRKNCSIAFWHGPGWPPIIAGHRSEHDLSGLINAFQARFSQRGNLVGVEEGIRVEVGPPDQPWATVGRYPRFQSLFLWLPGRASRAPRTFCVELGHIVHLLIRQTTTVSFILSRTALRVNPRVQNWCQFILTQRVSKRKVFSILVNVKVTHASHPAPGLVHAGATRPT